ncbi:MAG TPA: hypothetical protein VJ853_01795 [Thermoanaerobaculia bacterium]|nr:hypothetical protein [Thermoanaerobaculia bacterium]
MHSHRFALIAALFLAACASGGKHPNLAISVSPLSGRVLGSGIRGGAATGDYTVRVTVENRSQEDVTIHSIRVGAADAGLMSNDVPQDVEETIAPGAVRQFDMYLSVSTTGRTLNPTPQVLQSVSVDLSCTGSASGDFTAGGTYSLSV